MTPSDFAPFERLGNGQAASVEPSERHPFAVVASMRERLSVAGDPESVRKLLSVHAPSAIAPVEFMSGWGGAAGGSSVAGWACRPEVAHIVERWVRNRRDMTRVRYLGDRPRGAHVHIYVVEPGHPALRQGDA